MRRKQASVSDAFKAYRPRNGWNVLAPCSRSASDKAADPPGWESGCEWGPSSCRIPFFGTLRLTEEPEHNYGFARYHLAQGQLLEQSLRERKDGLVLRDQFGNIVDPGDTMNAEEALLMVGVCNHERLVKMMMTHAGNLLGKAKVAQHEGNAKEAEWMEIAAEELEAEATNLSDDDYLRELAEAESEHQKDEERSLLKRQRDALERRIQNV